METSRSEEVDGTGDGSPDREATASGRDPVVELGSDVRIELPADATPDEAAAIVAAIESHLASLDATDGHASARPPWDGTWWGLVGRIARPEDGHVRVPLGVPEDAWTVASRKDRF